MDGRLEVAGRAHTEHVGGLWECCSTADQRQKEAKGDTAAYIDEKAIRQVGSVLPLALGRENLQTLNDLRKQNGDEAEIAGRGKGREGQRSSKTVIKRVTEATPSSDGETEEIEVEKEDEGEDKKVTPIALVMMRTKRGQLDSRVAVEMDVADGEVVLGTVGAVLHVSRSR